MFKREEVAERRISGWRHWSRKKEEEEWRKRRIVKERRDAARATPKVRESQSGSPASCFQSSLCENPTETPLTLNKEKKREKVATGRRWKEKDGVTEVR